MLHHSDLGAQYKTFQKWTKLVISGKQPVSKIDKFKKEADIDKKVCRTMSALHNLFLSR